MGAGGSLDVMSVRYSMVIICHASAGSTDTTLGSATAVMSVFRIHPIRPSAIADQLYASRHLAPHEVNEAVLDAHEAKLRDIST